MAFGSGVIQHHQGDLGARGGDHRQPGGHVHPSDKPATL